MKRPILALALGAAMLVGAWYGGSIAPGVVTVPTADAQCDFGCNPAPEPPCVTCYPAPPTCNGCRPQRQEVINQLWNLANEADARGRERLADRLREIAERLAQR
jgi:hypothetical protein